ncbi:hypothetical protein F5Y05DRAFT_122069 [Hypoxylon sp. FL0543]|nr:hypothetical protein F5Y05DRAFT_122069 [Hypoxylon sp. FL0543]
MSFLYLVPVISSTSALYFAWDQYLFLSIFLKKDIQAPSNRLQSSYWQTFFPRGSAAVLGLISITSGASFALLRTQAAILQEKNSYNWYLAGGILALCHLLWAPSIMPVVDTLQDSKKDVNEGTITLRRWINIHLTRALTVDLACFVSCVVAAAKTISS